MPRLRRQIETPLAIGDTFTFIANFDNAMHWDPGVASSRRLDPGPLRVGARYALGIRMRGRVAPMEYRVSVLEPPHRVVLVGEGSGVSAVDDIRFEPRGTGTRVDYTADIRLTGLARLAGPFLGGAFEKIARDALEGMRLALDSRAGTANAASVGALGGPSVGAVPAGVASTAASSGSDRHAGF
jgi:carbon monoxide dehydrogenase subunit G